MKRAAVAVAPRSKISVAENGQKLRIVDESATIQRHACSGCGVCVQVCPKGAIEEVGASQ